jgi:hypothetical protein
LEKNKHIFEDFYQSREEKMERKAINCLGNVDAGTENSDQEGSLKI